MDKPEGGQAVAAREGPFLDPSPAQAGGAGHCPGRNAVRGVGAEAGIEAISEFMGGQTYGKSAVTRL